MSAPIGLQAPRIGPNTRWADKRRTTAPAPSRLRMMTVNEIATEIRMSKMTVYRLIHNKELAAVRVGRSFRVAESEFIRYVKENWSGDTRALTAHLVPATPAVPPKA